jgi:carboxylesterase
MFLKSKDPAFGALMGVGSPATLESPGAAPEVIAFHGFSGTPQEVALVAEAAREIGLGAYAPLLPGHGTHARDLSTTGWKEWIAFAETVFLERTEGAPAILSGLSMGSLLALHLAAKYPSRVTGLVLLANAIRLKSPYPGTALRLAGFLRLPDFWMPKAAPDIGDKVGRESQLTYNAQPVHAAIEVEKAGRRVRSELGQIKAPALILHGRRDLVCPWTNAPELERALGSNDKRVVILERSHHILTRDREASIVREEVTKFLKRLATSVAA